jgi:hypothetical protein
MPAALIAVVVIAAAVLVAVWLVRRSSRSSSQPGSKVELSASTAIEHRATFPPQGILVAENVLRSAGSSPDAFWGALEAAAVPIALEYYPVSEAELAKYRSIPVNASAQQAMVKVLEAVDPSGPTLFRAVLPKGAELVKAVGAEGFRGFSRTGGKTAHAVLKPVAVGGAIAAGWPVLAVAGTVMAVDMAAQREQRAHQRRVEAALARQDERYYRERITSQRSADAQLSRAISLLLDGREPSLELALKSADDEFHRSHQFLEQHSDLIGQLVEGDGKVNYHRLDEMLGGPTKEADHFVRELHLARAAIAIRRKALIADAASLALADPENPYTALRKFLEGQAHQLEQADAMVVELTDGLMAMELKGRWNNRKKSVAKRQEHLRTKISPPNESGGDEDVEVLYLATGSGELLQLLPASDGEAPAPEGSIIADEAAATEE